MFAMPLSKESRNAGIMSGFDMEEMQDDVDTNADMEDMPPMACTPQNPEILMNTLRGDMRSVDARYMELAQMVGEEAAMETPPEVLAMLQPQFAQQGGIGGLPQAQAMAPQGMAPQGMMPGMGAMPTDQGAGIPMPEGMAGAPPFFQGGAEQAPPTPDGLPPMQAAGGAFITNAARFAQFGADKTAAAAAAASRFMASGNAAAGRLMSQGFPQTFRPVFENVRGPGGRYTAEQFLTYPTLTQHMANIAGPRVMGPLSRLTGAATPGAPAVLGAVGTLGAVGAYRGATAPGEDPVRQKLLKDYEDAYYKVTDRSIPMPSLSNVSNEQLAQFVAGLQAKAVPPVQVPAAPAAAGAAAAPTDNADFIRQVIEGGDSAATEPAQAAAAGTAEVRPNVAAPKVEAGKSRIERIREAQKEYAPLYKELLGDTKEDMYVNAMLMLADAGFKYASLPAKAGTTPMSLLAQASQGLPQGFMALLAQAKDRQIKVDTAALSQAVSDVQEQDKYAQRLKEIMLRGDYDLLREQAKKGGVITEDGGAGLLVSKDKSGSFLGFSVDPDNPTVKTAVASRFTLRPTDNPFVTNRGEAPTSVETDKGERVKLTSTLRSLDNSLATLDSLKGVYTQAYGPGAWFSDKVNNLLVPVLPTATLRPNLDLTDASTRISTGMNSILKNIASANDGGRVAVQEQEWARETAKGISDPTRFFADKEVAAKQFNSMEAMLRNARQQVLTQLGYEKNDFVMSTPNTGTQSDPFVIPSDADARKRMYTFLGGTIGRIQDPRATVYLRMPNGAIQSATPTQLIGLMQ
jgi:hypothetical protein